MLSLRLELLTGRYVACEYNNRNRAEWPPHPARVFSALVAAYHESNKPAGGEQALRWLETLPPPQLCHSSACRREVKTHFVPVNDKAFTDVSAVAKAWAKLGAPDQTDKQRIKAEADLRKAYAKAGAADTKPSKSFREAVEHVMPATRTKQPRAFPSVVPEHPVVFYMWDETPSEALRAGLDAIAAALVRVGHSSSLVAAMWTDEAPDATLVPSSTGDELLRWVRPGQLDALQALHAEAPFAEQRVMPFSVARYKRPGRSVEVVESCFSSRFIVLRRAEGPRLPIQATEQLADTVRRALIRHAVEPVAPLISGHVPNGATLEADHLAVVPLSYVDGRYADGELLGVALVPPAASSREELQPLHEAVARWEAATEERGEAPQAVLTLGQLGRWTLERNVDISPLHNLRESTWTRASTCWASVTPVVLDRHPKSAADDQAGAVAHIHATLIAACRRIGLPEPLEIETSDDPFFVGSERARQFRRRHGSTDRRPLIHVWLRFDREVRGPVLLGAGRYRGLGLLRPWGDRHD